MNAGTGLWESNLIAERRKWKAKKQGPVRPLRKLASGDLRLDGIHEAIRTTLGLRTLGEARDLVGRELRIRTRETGT